MKTLNNFATNVDFAGMIKAFERVIEAQFQKDSPFHQPINSDAALALRNLKELLQHIDSVLPDWGNRHTDSLAGWINELATLGDHPRSMEGWLRDAIKTIVTGLQKHAAVGPIRTETNKLKCSVCGSTKNVRHMGGSTPYLCPSPDCIPY